MSLDSAEGVMAIARDLQPAVIQDCGGPIIWDDSDGRYKQALRALEDMLLDANKSFNLFFTAGDKSARIQVVHHSTKLENGQSTGQNQTTSDHRKKVAYARWFRANRPASSFWKLNDPKFNPYI